MSNEGPNLGGAPEKPSPSGGEHRPSEDTTLVIKSGGRRERVSYEAVQRCDFRQPAFLAAGELRRVRLRHEEFLRSLAARLSVYLRLEFSVQTSKLQTLTYHQFAGSLSDPTHLTLFKAEPLKGVGLLDMPPRLGLAIVDRLLGGTAQSQNSGRELTEIETALLDQAIHIILNEWCSQWLSIQDLKPVLLAHESHARFLQTAPRDTVMFCLSIETRVGDCVEQMRLALPHYTMEPLVKQLAAETIADEERESPAVAAPVRWNSELADVPMRLTAEWQGVEMTARELASLQPGDVVLLDPQLTEKLQLRLASVPKFAGRLGTQGAKWAVEVTETLND